MPSPRTFAHRSGSSKTLQHIASSRSSHLGEGVAVCASGREGGVVDPRSGVWALGWGRGIGASPKRSARKNDPTHFHPRPPAIHISKGGGPPPAPSAVANIHRSARVHNPVRAPCMRAREQRNKESVEGDIYTVQCTCILTLCIFFSPTECPRIALVCCRPFSPLIFSCVLMGIFKGGGGSVGGWGGQYVDGWREWMETGRYLHWKATND